MFLRRAGVLADATRRSNESPLSDDHSNGEEEEFFPPRSDDHPNGEEEEFFRRAGILRYVAMKNNITPRASLGGATPFECMYGKTQKNSLG